MLSSSSDAIALPLLRGTKLAIQTPTLSMSPLLASPGNLHAVLRESFHSGC
jgi:hypothetical protein